MGGGSTCLTGKSEKETLLKELGWTASWASSLLRHLKSTYEVMSACTSLYGPNFEPSADPQARLDAMSIQLAGACRNLRDHFDLGYYHQAPGEEEPTHENLERSLKRLLEQSSQKVPIPVNEIRLEPKPEGDIRKGLRKEIEDQILCIFAARQKIQNILDRVYGTKQECRQPSIQLQLKVISPSGDPLKLDEEVDVEGIASEAIEKQIAAEATRKDAGEGQAQISPARNLGEGEA